MSRTHVVCRDCPFEGVAPSEEVADDAVEAHERKEPDHEVVAGVVEDG